MRVGQWESERVVVEFPICPFGDRMARGASGARRREVRLDVIGDAAAESGSAVPGRQMAAHAIRRIQGIIVTDMAGSARRRCRRCVRAR